MRHLTPDMLTAQRVMQAGRAVQSLTRTLGRVCIEPAEGCARRAPSTKPPHAAVGSLRTRELAAAVQRGAGDNSAGTGSDNDGFSNIRVVPRRRTAAEEPQPGGSDERDPVRAELRRDVQRARDVFRQLAFPSNSLGLVTGIDVMAAAGLAFTSLSMEVMAADGLAFAFMTKTGVGVSVLGGHGFVIRKIPPLAEDDLVVKWSGPVFFNIYGVGLGLTLGAAEIDSIIVLDSQKAVDAFTKNQTAIDQDITLAAGKDKGTKLPGLALTLPDASAGVDAFEFSVSHGAIVDWSLRGAKIKRDDDRSRRVYGRSNLLPKDILAGRVPVPAEMEPLYDDMRAAALEYAKAINVFAADLAQQAAVTTVQAALMEPVE